MISFDSGKGMVQDVKLAMEFYHLNQRVKDLLKLVEDRFARRGRSLVITDVWRQRTTDSGVHEAFRAVDLRTWGISDEEGREIEKEINVWVGRGDGKPTALYHDSGHGVHMHIQVPG